MIGRFWPLLVIAFFVGSLFRLYIETGIGFFRMFGTLGIVVLGAVASRIIVRAQLDEGERLIHSAMQNLPPECDVWRLSGRTADRAVSGPNGTVILLTSNIAHYARGWGLHRSLERLTARMERAAEVVQRTLFASAGGDVDVSGAEEGEGGDGDDAQAPAEDEARPEQAIHRAVVFLRRQVREEDRAWLRQRDIDVVDPEAIEEYVTKKTVGGEGRHGSVPWPDWPEMS